MASGGAREHSWGHFEEYARQRESVGVGMMGASRNPLSPTAGRLHKEDMAIYGREPATDRMLLVICHLCGRVLKLQAVLKHNEIYHCDNTNVLTLSHLPIQTVGQSSSGTSTLSENGRDGLGSSGHSGNMVDGRKDKGGGGSGGKKGSKEYDPDRHCGVWLDQEKRHCRKSITCKLHTVAQRQKVVGRSKPFRLLLAEHKKNKKLKKMEKRQSFSAVAPPAPLPPPTHLPAPPLTPPPILVNSIPSPAQSSRELSLSPQPVSVQSDQSDSFSPSAILWDKDTEEEDDREKGAKLFACDDSGDSLSSSVLVDQQYPQPVAACSFGSRRYSQALTCFSRRNDSLRGAVASLRKLDKDLSCLADPSLIKKHRQLFKQRHQLQRKYIFYGKQDHVLLNQKPKFTAFIPPPPPSPPPPTSSSASIPTSQFYNGAMQFSTTTAPQGASAVVNNTANTPAVVPVTSGGGRKKRSRRGVASKVHSNATREDNGLVISSSGPMVASGGLIVSSSESAVTPGGMVTGQIEVTGDSKVKDLEGATVNMSHSQEKGNTNRLKTPTVNGLVPTAISQNMSTHQQHSFTSPQRFLINPSEHSLLPPGILPLGSVGMTHSSSSAQYPPMSLPLHLPPPILQQLMAQNQQALSTTQGVQQAGVWLPTGSFQDGSANVIPGSHCHIPGAYNSTSSSSSLPDTYSASEQLPSHSGQSLSSSLTGSKVVQNSSTHPLPLNLHSITRPRPPPSSSSLQQVDTKAGYMPQLLTQTVAHHTQQVL